MIGNNLLICTSIILLKELKDQTQESRLDKSIPRYIKCDSCINTGWMIYSIFSHRDTSKQEKCAITRGRELTICVTKCLKKELFAVTSSYYRS